LADLNDEDLLEIFAAIIESKGKLQTVLMLKSYDPIFYRGEPIEAKDRRKLLDIARHAVFINGKFVGTRKEVGSEEITFLADVPFERSWDRGGRRIGRSKGHDK